MTILSSLHRMPEWGVYALLVPLITSVSIAMPFIGCRVFSRNDDRSKGAVEAYKAIVASLAFLLAFTLAQAQGALRSMESLIAQEAAALNTIDRSLLRYNSADFTALRGSLHELIGLIPTDEWPALSHGERSAKVEAIVDTLSRRIRTTEAGNARQQSLLNELISKLDEFTDKREELINGASTTLPDFFYDTIGALFVVLAALGLFVSPNGERVLTIAGVTAAASLVLSLVIVLDAPFAGGSKVNPEPIERVGRLVKARQVNPIMAQPTPAP